MDDRQAQALLEAQRAYFRTGATLPIPFRQRALERLGEAVEAFEEPIYEALRADLGKSRWESYLCEVGMLREELGYMRRHVAAFARERRVPTPLAQWASRSFVKPSPYGVALIMSPWNYPLLLTLGPLVDALAAGNTAILKPSAYSPHVSAVIGQLIGGCFPPEYVAVVTGGRAENTCLLGLDVDYLFFTGSQAVGKQVMARAAEHLTPVTLELGGKSPCIVDATADLALAARRIVFGKFLNCGQTCVAPDYIWCQASVRDRLVEHLKREIILQFGEQPLENPNYGKIINEKHFERLLGLMDSAKTVWGGETDREGLRIAPTLLTGVSWSDRVMGEEIFGPLLPVLTYQGLEEVVDTLQGKDSPLALYVFSSDRGAVELLKSRISFGGGCINDTVIHLATTAMGFGGVGGSGMGSYHGRAGFDTFTHYKSMVDKKTWVDLPVRYQPYTGWKNWLVRRFMK